MVQFDISKINRMGDEERHLVVNEWLHGMVPECDGFTEDPLGGHTIGEIVLNSPLGFKPYFAHYGDFNDRYNARWMLAEKIEDCVRVVRQKCDAEYLWIEDVDGEEIWRSF
jgi:hypothetical protein